VARSLTVARALALVLVLVACPDGDASEDDSRPALPPGMVARAATNADLPPPPIPLSPRTPIDTARAQASWPHDTAAYTQGLLVADGRLLESTGIAGRSDVREVDLTTGRVARSRKLPRQHFGEGIALVGGRLFQVTWRAGQGYVYDVRTLAPVDSFMYQGEGWGLASDGRQLYLSDGSADIKVMDPATRTVQRTFAVTDGGRRVHALNELEWVDGELWANVYQTDWIARIDPASGTVLRWVWLGGLLTPAEKRGVQSRGGVANGIAYDAPQHRVLLTGKYWPRLFAVATAH
jgi:glutaminyl-peptide cyclotransferase